MLTRLTNSQKKTLFCSIWAIWSDQNKALHEGLHQTVLKTVQFIQKYLGEWERDNSILLGQRIEEERWRPSKGNTAIQWGIERGFRQVEIEGDALSIIKKFQNNEEDKSVLRAYILDIKELSKSFEDCRFKKSSVEGDRIRWKRSGSIQWRGKLREPKLTRSFDKVGHRGHRKGDWVF
ncbi:hypothetical protein Godav_017248 [Gossypium davidsonii]|uniref:RNase H type-1 domain-containing protein n=1 Tax=Gossypium davidsonii TaxID=34287 RepID=A0A7J8QSN6_GOSDV|nr:hypothetical protein [Gossypium davidsonii]